MSLLTCKDFLSELNDFLDEDLNVGLFAFHQRILKFLEHNHTSN